MITIYHQIFAACTLVVAIVHLPFGLDEAETYFNHALKHLES